MDDDEKTPRKVGQNLVATIVSSYVKHNTVSADALPTVIASVHQALSGLGKPALPVEPLTPAVPVRQSVRPDYVVCLECGFRSQTLGRHLRVQHALERPAYFARWQLPPDHRRAIRRDVQRWPSKSGSVAAEKRPMLLLPPTRNLLRARA